MKIKEVNCGSILSESKLYGMDYSINPYTGCQNGCRYCYASYMKKYTGHDEDWGEFVDVKSNAPEKLKEDLLDAEPGSVLLSSVTDPYQAPEEKYKLTREILEVLRGSGFTVTILTKNDLVLRDLDVLRKFDQGKLSVGFTLNFSEDEDRKNWEPDASSTDERVEALEKISSEGIPTYVHVGPWLEGITDLEGIMETVGSSVTELQVENINWRRKEEIMKVIGAGYPQLAERYREISRGGPDYRKKLQRKVRELRGKWDVPVRLFLD